MSKDKWVTLVSTMNRLTQEGRLIWERKEPPTNLFVDPSTKIGSFYATKFHEKNIAIFEKLVSDYDDYGHLEWFGRVTVGVFSADWALDWEVPRVAGTEELFDSVKYQVSGVGQWLEECLRDYGYET